MNGRGSERAQVWGPWAREYQFGDVGSGEAESWSPGGTPIWGEAGSQRWFGKGALVLRALVREGLGPGALAQGPAWLQPWHSTLSPSGTKPWPTREVEQRAQAKQLWCQWRSSKDTYLPPPSPGGRLDVSSADLEGGPGPRSHPTPDPIPWPAPHPLSYSTLLPPVMGRLQLLHLGAKSSPKQATQ